MPRAPEPAQVDDSGQGVERLSSADVRGGLLAADVLLAGLQREHEAALAVEVRGLAGDAPGHPADQRLGRREEPERGAAEVEPVPKALTLADGEVDATLAGGLEQGERKRIARADGQSAHIRGGRGERLEILDGTEEVRLLDDHRAESVIERSETR